MEGFEIMENSMAEQSRCNKKKGGDTGQCFLSIDGWRGRKNSTSEKKRII